MRTQYRLGIDAGGTFTDFALVDDQTGALAVHKQLTTPADPSQCVLAGLAALLARTGTAIAALTPLPHGPTLVPNPPLS